MNCPNCGSNLVVKGKFCPHCGTAIPEDISIKIDSRQEILDHARVAEAQEDGKAKIAKEKTKRRYGCLTVIIVLILAVVVLAIYYDYSDRQSRSSRSTISYTSSSSSDYFSEMRTKHFAEVERLQRIEDEILEDIRNECYDQALLKAQTLYYTGTYSSDTKKAWDEKREALIQELNALKGGTHE